ncbi:MAG: hypothetical protein ABIU96_07655 [Rhodanobacter sp.]
MKRLVTAATLAFALALPIAHAGQNQSPDMHDHGSSSSMQHDKMGQGMMNQGTMQKRMQEMRQTMQQIQKTQDPTERQRLMQEHMQQMQTAMGGMQGMMGDGASHAAMHEKIQKMDPEKRQQTMQEHMQMMQDMLQQMQAHMQAQTAMDHGK